MDLEKYLQPTYFLDCDSEAIVGKTRDLTAGEEDPVARARTLFYFVRDSIRYNVFGPKERREDFRASATLARGEGYCVQKAVLLAAFCRAAGIPARVGFAMIRNNILPPELAEVVKTNIFPWHGYAQVYLNGRWVKATPAFDRDLSERNRIIPVEFNGWHDAPFHRRNRDGLLHIEYLKDRGPFDDLPLDDLWQALRENQLMK